MKNKFWWMIALAVVVWLLWMTLRPNTTVATDLTPLTGPAAARGISIHWLIDIAGNIVVFVPLGAAVALALGDHPARLRLLGGSGAGALLSASIELAQLALPSRVSAVGDWALNTAGAAIGAALAVFAPPYLKSIVYFVLRITRNKKYAIRNTGYGSPEKRHLTTEDTEKIEKI
jgi:glycopeptide antibiotics resistance protein